MTRYLRVTNWRDVGEVIKFVSKTPGNASGLQVSGITSSFQKIKSELALNLVKLDMYA